MARELVYTSVERGLKSGSRGFCTVASSEGISPEVLRILEMLSTYRHLGAPHSPDNPANCAHLIFSVAQTTDHLFSKMTDAGLDYSGRGNFLIQHILPSLAEIEELYQSNPTDIFTDIRIFMRNWEGKPRKLPDRNLTLPPSVIHPCNLWKTFTGEAGWAGILAAAAESKRSVCLIGEKDLPFLALFQEALSLLPPVLRWNTTFATFYTATPPGVSCLWKGIIKGEPEEAFFAADQKSLRLDLTKPLPPLPKDPAFEKFIKAAETGKVPPGLFTDPISRNASVPHQDPKKIFSAGSVSQRSVFDLKISSQTPNNNPPNVFEEASKKRIPSNLPSNLPGISSEKGAEKITRESTKENRFSEVAGDEEALLKRSQSFLDFAEGIFSEKPPVSPKKDPFDFGLCSTGTSRKTNSNGQEKNTVISDSFRNSFSGEKNKSDNDARNDNIPKDSVRKDSAPKDNIRKESVVERIMTNAGDSFKEFEESEEDVIKRSSSNTLLFVFIFLVLACIALGVFVFFALGTKE